MEKDKIKTTQKENIEAIYPLSPMQEGMLYRSVSDPDSTLYFEQSTFTYVGELDTENYRRVWQRAVDRHPALRTLVLWERKGQPLQLVRRQATLGWREEDWRELSSEEQCKQLAAFEENDRQEGINLKKAPLMRFALIRMGVKEYRLVWSYHHVMFDGWSASVLLNEVFCNYDAFNRGEELESTPLAPYENYISWLQKQDVKKAEAFWRKTFDGFTAVTSLHSSLGLKQDESLDKYGTENGHLSEDTTSALKTLAREHQLTLNTIVQGAWALLLSRYTGETDVVFGTPVSSRPAALENVEAMVGLFLNTLALRVQTDTNAPVVDWLKQCQLQQLEAREFDFSPLADVQRWSDVPPGQSLFTNILVFKNYPKSVSEELDIGFQVTDVRVHHQTDFPLTVSVDPSARLTIEVVYDCRYYDSTTITRLVGHLRTILVNIANEPTQKVSAISMLTDSEKEQRLNEWNQPLVKYPHFAGVHHLFEDRVDHDPDSIALIFEGQHLTYGELNQRANQLAHYLISIGIGPECLVGVCLERSLEMSIALLAILKAGGVYVPFDPGLPENRLKFILDDTRTEVILTQEGLREGMPSGQVTVLCLDSDREIWAHQATANPTRALNADNLFNVIYTSGSTGRPKGVMVPHRGIINLMLLLKDAYGIDSTDRFLQKTPYSFDASVWELFLPLTTGARLIYAKPEGHKDPEYIRDIIVEQGITTLNFGPSMLSIFLQTPDLEQCVDLRRVFCGGEALQMEHVRLFYERLSHTELHNQYGPTEASVLVTRFACQPNETYRSVPIGRATPNNQLYLLDTHLHPVPVGVTGELYIGGAQLARGYLNRKELTQSTFIENPYHEGGHPSERLYKTGDLARQMPDGNIEFMGRVDFQVKIRGYRVELGEIEARLKTFSGVGQATVVLREDRPGDQRLVAYYVAEAGKVVKATASEIRDHLRSHLPDYMIPQYIVALDALPLTSNGKIDRKSLPVPYRVAGKVKRRALQLTTPNEKLLANIWQELLGVERVTGEDNFFELGGHSLLSLQFIRRVKEETGVDIPPRETAFNTLSQFGAMLDGATPNPQATDASTTATVQEDDKQAKKETKMGSRLKRLFRK